MSELKHENLGLKCIPTKANFVAEYLHLPFCLPTSIVSDYLVFNRQ